MTDRTGQYAVIFLSQRVDADEDGYAAAAAAMDALAAAQPGYRGVDSARGADGFGITVSWWADAESARAWREHPEHAAIRTRGRAEWYERHAVAAGVIERAYGWTRA